MVGTVVVRTGMLILAMVLVAAACGGSGDDDGACRTCTASENCDNDQECALAVDGERRCFELDEATCTLDRVTVGRAPTPVPTAIP